MPWQSFPEHQKYSSSFPNTSQRGMFSTGISNFPFRLRLWVGVLNAEKNPTCTKHESTFQISKGVISASHTSAKADDTSEKFLMFIQFTQWKRNWNLGGTRSLPGDALQTSLCLVASGLFNYSPLTSPSKCCCWYLHNPSTESPSISIYRIYTSFPFLKGIQAERNSVKGREERQS